jgi:hypothetical protein
VQLYCALTVIVMSDSDTSEGDCNREEFVAKHVDSGKAGKFGDELELAWRWWCGDGVGKWQRVGGDGG